MFQLTLARKALLLTLFAILTMAAAIQAIAHVFVLDHVQRVEREDVVQHTRSVEHVIRLLGEDFAAAGKDWSDWDDLYAFAKGDKPNFADTYLNYSAIASAQWDILAIYSANTGQVWSGRIDATSKSIVPLSQSLNAAIETSHLLAHNPVTAPEFGLVLAGNEIFLFASRAIRKTTPQGEPVSGRFVFAKTIDSAWTERLKQLTLNDTWLQPAKSAPRDHADTLAREQLYRAPTNPVAILVSDRKARGYLHLNTLNDSPGLLLGVQMERRLGQVGQSILSGTLYALAFGGFGLLVAAFFIVRQGLIEPLRKLRDAVRRLEDGHHSALILSRKDELGDLASGFNRMARTMRERETTLRQAHTELKLILDSTADALCGCTLTGNFRGTPSAMGPKWFGPPQSEQDVATWLFGNQPALVAIFRLGLAQVVDEKLPLSVALDQLPRRFTRGPASYEIVYRPFREGEDVIGLLLVIKDVTSKMLTEQTEREARELQIAIGNMVRDRGAFDHFVDECESLLQQMHTETSLANRLVHLHTLKGACSIFGLLTFSESCQYLEQQIAVNAEAMNEEALRVLRRTFHSTLSRVRRFAPELGDKRLSISLSDYSNFVELLEKRLGHERLLAEAMRLPLEPGERLMTKLVHYSQRLAHELGLRIEVVVDDGGLRLVAGSTKLLWSALLHGVRNALEHGIEPETERVLRGKPATGKLQFIMRERGHHLVVSIIDDGRGIDWQTLQERAYSSRLPSSREDLVELLFTDGLSTKNQTSSISGRGIGLSAIRATCHALGGTCIVFAGPSGVGTELHCSISMAVATHPPSDSRTSASHSRLSASPPISGEEELAPASTSLNH